MKKTLFGIMALAIAFTFGTMMSCSEKVEEEQPMTVAQINDSIENYINDTLFIEGTVEGICKCEGKTLKLEGANFKCISDQAFADSLMGQKVRVKGVLVEDNQFTVEILQAQLDTLRAQALAAATEEVTTEVVATEEAPVEESAAEETCCNKEEEHKCCCMNDTNKVMEMLQVAQTNGKNYYPVYTLKVTSIEVAPAAEPAK